MEKEFAGVQLIATWTPSFLKDLAIPFERVPSASITMTLPLSYKVENITLQIYFQANANSGEVLKG